MTTRAMLIKRYPRGTNYLGGNEHKIYVPLAPWQSRASMWGIYRRLRAGGASQFAAHTAIYDMLFDSTHRLPPTFVSGL